MPEGTVRGRLRVTDLRQGVLFVPFPLRLLGHPERRGARRRGTRPRAANEATAVTNWDPASKQPLFKVAAAALTLVRRGDGTCSPRPRREPPLHAAGTAVPTTSGGHAAHAMQRRDSAWDTAGGGR
ncbi:hypothetical protein ACU686_13840 [Yinghuangia aomiensis]